MVVACNTRLHHFEMLKQMLCNYAWNFLFKHTKFLPVPENIVENIVEKQVEENYGPADAPEGLVVSATCWAGTVKGAVTTHRHNAQTLVTRKNYKSKLCNATTEVVSHSRSLWV